MSIVGPQTFLHPLKHLNTTPGLSGGLISLSTLVYWMGGIFRRVPFIVGRVLFQKALFLYVIEVLEFDVLHRKTQLLADFFKIPNFLSVL